MLADLEVSFMARIDVFRKAIPQRMWRQYGYELPVASDRNAAKSISADLLQRNMPFIADGAQVNWVVFASSPAKLHLDRFERLPVGFNEVLNAWGYFHVSDNAKYLQDNSLVLFADMKGVPLFDELTLRQAAQWLIEKAQKAKQVE